MKLLLDTHIVLWFFDNVGRLSENAYKAVTDTVNEKYVSIVSAWELAVKISLGKLTFEGGVADFFSASEENGFELLPIKEDYIKQLESLPFIHRDPFDRMLVASVLAEGMHFVTSDANIRLYDVAYIW
jgi:PIN domain nuclease of toxin-antitoxin system